MFLAEALKDNNIQSVESNKNVAERDTDHSQQTQINDAPQQTLLTEFTKETLTAQSSVPSGSEAQVSSENGAQRETIDGREHSSEAVDQIPLSNSDNHHPS